MVTWLAAMVAIWVIAEDSRLKAKPDIAIAAER
jgi:hypothetical protein